LFLLIFLSTNLKIFAQNDPLKDSLELYEKAGNLKKAMEFALQLEIKIRKKKGEKSAEYGKAAFVVGNLAFKTDDYPKAEVFLNKSLEARKKALGEEHPDVANSYTRLGSLRMYQGQFKRSDSLHQKALAIRLKLMGPDDKDVAKTYSSLCQVNGRGGDAQKALQYGLESCRIYKKLGGEESPDYLTNLKQVANVQASLGLNVEAEAINRSLIEVLSRIRGEKDKEVTVVKINLGTVLYNQGRYREALNLFLDALPQVGPGHPMYISMCNNIGTLYVDLNDFVLAEHYLSKVVSQSKKADGFEPEMYIPLGNYGLAHLHLGNLKKAELLLKEALALIEKNQSKENSNYATALLNLGLVYQASGQLAKASETINKAHSIFIKIYSEAHQNTNQALTQFGNLLVDRHYFGQAEASLVSANKISQHLFGQTGPRVSQTWGNLGLLFLKTGRYRAADSCFAKAIGTYIPGMEIKNPSYANLKKNQAITCWLGGQPAKAEESYKQCINQIFSQISNTFPVLSQNEKEQFYDQSRYPLEVFNSFCVDRSRQNPAILGNMFDVQLETKALLLNSSAKWKQRIKTSGDKKLFARFTAWEELQDQIKTQLNSDGRLNLKRLDSLEEVADMLEKELSARSEHFARLSDKKQFHWKDIQKALKPGEASLEIIRFRKFGQKGLVRDSGDIAKAPFTQFDLTDTIWYAALIVTPNCLYPEIVVLQNGNDLEGKHLIYNKSCIRKQVLDQTSYEKYWKKIGDKLKGLQRIYVSPDGVFHSINLNTLYNPATRKYLIDENDIQLITSGKDLLQKSKEEETNKLAYLFGFPNFEAPFESHQVLADAERYTPLPYYLNRERSLFSEEGEKGGILIAELPGTKVEVERISDILGNNGWEVHAFTRDKALEENLKESFKPRLLHIATHGFFETDTARIGNPLLRSGLLLSGAAKTLSTGKPDFAEDGILTAYEAMNLNLDNTDLVVLSACETGLGEIKNGEGVYGLQRAFKVAGARSIIMSLWKVDDNATQELMVSFYKNWLGEAVGAGRQRANGSKAVFPPEPDPTTNSKRSAFLKAQKELKAKYPNPYYWGAFVMVGE
jgi:CHAT domain-containing protein/Tfp pilus assembly protein PilF